LRKGSFPIMNNQERPKYLFETCISCHEWGLQTYSETVDGRYTGSCSYHRYLNEKNESGLPLPIGRWIENGKSVNPNIILSLPKNWKSMQVLDEMKV